MNTDFFSRVCSLRRDLGALLQHVFPVLSPTPLQPVFAVGGDGSEEEPRETIRARRRRPGGATPPEERETAQAPQRERPRPEPAKPRPSSAQQPTTLGPTAEGGEGGLPMGLILAIAALAVVALCVIVFFMSQSMSGPEAQQEPPPAATESMPTPLPTVAAPTQAPIAVATQTPTRVAIATVMPTPTRVAAAATGPKWLIMLYQDADDQVLEEDIYIDLNEAEQVGSTDRVQIVAQIDRFRGAFAGDGNWTSTKRFYVTRDSDLTRVGSRQVADLGEVNMSSPETLVDFVTWAVKTYPADKYVLILSDHGMGWPGGMNDPVPSVRHATSAPLADALGNMMYLNELDKALGDIRARTGVEKFELIGLDACLMGHLEVYTALAPHARYAVASQETEPSLGWAYAHFLRALNDNPNMTGGDLGRLIVSSYIREDQRIQDPQARAEFLSRGSPMAWLFGTPSAEELARQMEGEVTLAAVDLGRIPDVIQAVNDLTAVLAKASQQNVAAARTYAQSFTSVFGSQVPPSYIDLGSFANVLKSKMRDTAVTRSADQVLAAIKSAVLAEKHGPQKPGATGISIYFPNSQLYQSGAAGPRSYTVIAERFAASSLWDDYLAFHYTGRTFRTDAKEPVLPAPGAAVRGPGAGKISVSRIKVSSNVAAPGRPVLMSADISGENVGYIYLFVGYLDKKSQSIFVADMDYLESDTTRKVEGVYYPEWAEGRPFTLEFEWEPIMFAISDGKNKVTAALMPRDFGASPEKAVYTVDGIYTTADGSDSRYARLYFSNGKLRQVFGFTGENGTGSPREIKPQSGDTFTVFETWLDQAGSGKAAKAVRQKGGTLTFGSQMFTWVEQNAAPGEYVVGFIVTDMDGTSYPVYTTVTVQAR